MNKASSSGPVDAGDLRLRVRVIRFDADAGAPAALRRLAAVLEAEQCALHNVWIGAPVGDAEELVFVTLRPAGPAPVAAVVDAPPPAQDQATAVPAPTTGLVGVG